ncbi:MAG TPA: ATP-binding protein [Candidatus Limnocylindria bacterium]|nr:ATP-binding protein [Candidatus Limnocylindria bacterium]
MSITRSDALALLLALGAAIASLVVWNYGRVDIGMTLRTADVSEIEPDQPVGTPTVLVADLTPGGNADRQGFFPGMRIIDLTTTDGGDVRRGEPIGFEMDGALNPIGIGPWDYLGPIAVQLQTYGRDYALPIEAIPSARIDTAVAGNVYPPDHWIDAYAAIDRSFLEYQLQQSIWIMGVWVLLGLLVWRLLLHGVAGEIGRRHALKVGLAVATPALIWPVIQVGTPIGLGAGLLLPAAVALVLAWSLAGHHPDQQWAQTGRAGAFVAAALAGILVVRYVTAGIYSDDRPMLFFLAGTIAVIPAFIAAFVPGRSYRERGQLLSLGFVPAAALTIQSDAGPQVALPLVLLALLFGWNLVPVERLVSLAETGANRVKPRTTRVPATISRAAEGRGRDVALAGAIVVAGFAGLTLGFDGWLVIVGAGLAAATYYAVRRGLLGDAWIDAAVPLAAATGIPVMLAGLYGGFDGSMAWRAIPAAVAALGVAHVLAGRHPDAFWEVRLLTASFAVTLLVALLSLYGTNAAIPLVGLIALIPGVPIALAETGGEPKAISSRVEALVVAVTPGAAATMLVPPVGIILFGGWLVAVVAWRQFSVTPLIGFAQRTQLQRDLAVAAAETERARLAADLHDDALQQLTMLVRTLDEGGHKAEADEAREVATKLRSVVGDLRLPILDDLGAGAALEWLVERVEPLAGGPVKLERSDETRPPANVELAVFRVAQEALTNAIKHGKPPIAVRYDVRGDGRVTLAVDDAGEGIGPEAAEEAPKAGHFGLANMQQRAEQIGALLDVRRWPAGGTRVALEWRPQ